MTYKSFLRLILMTLSAMLAAVVLASCSDLNVPAAMTEVSRANGEREAAEAIREAEEAAAAEGATDAADPALAEDATVALNADEEETPAVNIDDTGMEDAGPDDMSGADGTDEDGGGEGEAAGEEDDSSAEDGDDEDDKDEELLGEPALVTEGYWTVSKNDVGVRVRTAPAGEILGFILRGDVISTTGEGRVLNNVAWGKVNMADGTEGWMALDLLEAASGTELRGTLGGNGDERTATTASTNETDESAADQSATDDTASDDDSGDDTASDDETGDDTTNDDDTTTVSTEPSATDGLSRLNVQPQAAFVSNRSVTLAVWSEPAFGSTNLGTMDEGDALVIVSAEGWRNGEVPFVRVAWNGVEGWADARFIDVAE